MCILHCVHHPESNLLPSTHTWPPLHAVLNLHNSSWMYWHRYLSMSSYSTSSWYCVTVFHLYNIPFFSSAFSVIPPSWFPQNKFLEVVSPFEKMDNLYLWRLSETCVETNEKKYQRKHIKSGVPGAVPRHRERGSDPMSFDTQSGHCQGQSQLAAQADVHAGV